MSVCQLFPFGLSASAVDNPSDAGDVFDLEGYQTWSTDNLNIEDMGPSPTECHSIEDPYQCEQLVGEVYACKWNDIHQEVVDWSGVEIPQWTWTCDGTPENCADQTVCPPEGVFHSVKCIGPYKSDSFFIGAEDVVADHHCPTPKPSTCAPGPAAEFRCSVPDGDFGEVNVASCGLDAQAYLEEEGSYDDSTYAFRTVTCCSGSSDSDGCGVQVPDTYCPCPKPWSFSERGEDTKEEGEEDLLGTLSLREVIGSLSDPTCASLGSAILYEETSSCGVNSLFSLENLDASTLFVDSLMTMTPSNVEECRGGDDGENFRRLQEGSSEDLCTRCSAGIRMKARQFLEADCLADLILELFEAGTNEEAADVSADDSFQPDSEELGQSLQMFGLMILFEIIPPVWTENVMGCGGTCAGGKNYCSSLLSGAADRNAILTAMESDGDVNDDAGGGMSFGGRRLFEKATGMADMIDQVNTADLIAKNTFLREVFGPGGRKFDKEKVLRLFPMAMAATTEKTVTKKTKTMKQNIGIVPNNREGHLRRSLSFSSCPVISNLLQTIGNNAPNESQMASICDEVHSSQDCESDVREIEDMCVYLATNCHEDYPQLDCDVNDLLDDLLDDESYVVDDGKYYDDWYYQDDEFDDDWLGDGGNSNGADDCVNTDKGVTDSDGDGCDVYKAAWCGYFDTDVFNSMEMCCICKYPTYDDDYYYGGDCYDSDYDATDSFGDSCADYTLQWCGTGDDDDFNSMEMCCICQGDLGDYGDDMYYYGDDDLGYYGDDMYYYGDDDWGYYGDDMYYYGDDDWGYYGDDMYYYGDDDLGYYGDDMYYYGDDMYYGDDDKGFAPPVFYPVSPQDYDFQDPTKKDGCSCDPEVPCQSAQSDDLPGVIPNFCGPYNAAPSCCWESYLKPSLEIIMRNKMKGMLTLTGLMTDLEDSFDLLMDSTVEGYFNKLGSLCPASPMAAHGSGTCDYSVLNGDADTCPDSLFLEAIYGTEDWPVAVDDYYGVAVDDYYGYQQDDYYGYIEDTNDGPVVDPPADDNSNTPDPGTDEDVDPETGEEADTGLDGDAEKEVATTSLEISVPAKLELNGVAQPEENEAFDAFVNVMKSTLTEIMDITEGAHIEILAINGVSITRRRLGDALVVDFLIVMLKQCDGECAGNELLDEIMEDIQASNDKLMDATSNGSNVFASTLTEKAEEEAELGDMVHDMASVTVSQYVAPTEDTLLASLQSAEVTIIFEDGSSSSGDGGTALDFEDNDGNNANTDTNADADADSDVNKGGDVVTVIVKGTLEISGIFDVPAETGLIFNSAFRKSIVQLVDGVNDVTQVKIVDVDTSGPDHVDDGEEVDAVNDMKNPVGSLLVGFEITIDDKSTIEKVSEENKTWKTVVESQLVSSKISLVDALVDHCTDLGMDEDYLDKIRASSITVTSLAVELYDEDMELLALFGGVGRIHVSSSFTLTAAAAAFLIWVL